jgi:hypothetical protein
MKRSTLLKLAVLALVLAGFVRTASAEYKTLAGKIAHKRAQYYSWHAGHYHTMYGMPLALVVPPTAEVQTHWGWGVGNYQITTIRHQFERNWPGPGYYNRGMFKPTPYWPAHTSQFGVYAVRGPW